MKSVAFSLSLLIFAACPLEAQVVCQIPMGRNACGPCAVVNSLIHAKNQSVLDQLPGSTGIEKAQSFATRFGNTRSTSFGSHRTAYSDEHGTTDSDLSVMVNSLFCQSAEHGVAPMYLDRLSDESAEAFVTRIRSSLDASIRAGFHPLLSVRAVAAQFDKSTNRTAWNSMGGHWVAVHGVEASSTDQLSFLMRFSDSLSGEMQTGFVYADKHRRGQVPMRFHVDSDGNEEWNWISSRNALTLVAPGMPLGTRRAKWNERAFIALRYAILRDGISR